MNGGDFTLNVRQVAQYPFAATAAATDAVLLQQGGIGGPYAYTSPAGLVTPSIAASISTATINLTGVGPIFWAQGQFLQATSSSFSFNWPGTPGLLLSILPTGDATLTGMLSVGRDPLTPFEVATKNYTDTSIATAKQLLTDNTVWTVNGKQGNVNLTWADLISMGGAPIMSPSFQGVPTVPSITDDNQHDWQIANTAFVQDVVNCKINALLHAHPFVWSFNGRIGNVCLTIDDVNAALAAPGAIAYATTPPLGDASGRIATTLFVDNSIEDLRSWVDQQNFAFDQQLSLYAPLASPQFSGIPTAPTAPPATSTGQLATTAYVMAAVQASTSGVVSFNGRTGIVDLTSNDITNATGALIASPVFTGTPQAPTAVAGTDTAQLATCAFVLNELGGASIGVMSFNGRGGAVVLTGADITGAGGALLAGPAFSGTPTAPTAASGDASQQLATTAFVAAAIAALSIGVSSFNSRTGAVTLTTNDISAAGGAVLASPIFSGQPTAPTASPGTSTTQLATTAYVMAAIAAATGVSSFNGRGGAVTLTAADVSGVGAAMLTGATFTGNVSLSSVGPSFTLNKTVTTNPCQIVSHNSGVTRWTIIPGNGTPESGGNVGSDFNITRYSDAGAAIDSPLSINRSNGAAIFSGNVTASTFISQVTATTGTYYFGSGSTKYIAYNGTNFEVTGGDYLIDNHLYVGYAGTTGVVYFGNTGSAYMQFDGTVITAAGGTFKAAGNIFAGSSGAVGSVYFGSAANGSVGINTASFNCFSNAAGSTGLYIPLNTSAWTSLSDARLPYKRAAIKLSVLDKIEAIQLYENEVEGRLELFGKAQEIDQSFPHVIKRGDDDDSYVPTGMSDERAWGLCYERLGIVALQGVKELLARIVALEAQLETIRRQA
jgi:hypothetical protein